MVDTLPLQNFLELTFNVLTAAVGIVVIVVGLRVTSKLTLSAHKRALWISFGAVALIVASSMARVWADFSRMSTFKDVGGAVAELVAVCSVGWAVRLLDRAEKEEVSPLRREANTNGLTALANRAFFHRAAQRRMELYERNGLPLACAILDVDDFKFYNDTYGHEGGAARRSDGYGRRSHGAGKRGHRYGRRGHRYGKGDYGQALRRRQRGAALGRDTAGTDT